MRQENEMSCMEVSPTLACWESTHLALLTVRENEIDCICNFDVICQASQANFQLVQLGWMSFLRRTSTQLYDLNKMCLNQKSLRQQIKTNQISFHFNFSAVLRHSHLKKIHRSTLKVDQTITLMI